MARGIGNRDPALLLTVEDDGCGFDPAGLAAARAGFGLGLSSMRERAGALGGHLTVDCAPGRGSRIIVTVPLAREEKR
jgi:signal transduction histidine kinase